MQLQFAKGRGGWKQIPVYDFSDWRLVYKDHERIVYRPSMLAFVHRLGATLVCALIILGLVYSAGGPSQLQGSVATAVYAVSGLFGAIGVIVPLSVLWNRTVVRRDHLGNLAVSSCGLFPRTRTWPIDSLDGITVVVQEEVSRGRHSVPRSLGWRWRVRLECKAAEASEPSPWLVEFSPCLEKTRPAEHIRPPEQAAVFVRWLAGVTGQRISGPSIVEYTGKGYTPHVVRRVSKSGEPASVNRQVYHSLDEMPPELRARAEQAMAQAREQGIGPGEPFQATSQQITISDSNGNVQTYNSPDEMPPDVRGRYEEMRRSRE